MRHEMRHAIAYVSKGLEFETALSSKLLPSCLGLQPSSVVTLDEKSDD